MQRTAIILAGFLVCINCFTQAPPIVGSNGQYPFVHYTPKDGLVNSRVRKAYQDSKGLMYFLTVGGLSIYDGSRFRNYSTQSGLPIDFVNDILEVGEDSLLIASNASVLNALVKGKIITLKTEGDSCPVINQFYRSDLNQIFLAGDEGLFLLENKKIRQLNVSRMLETHPQAPYLANITGTGNYLLLSTHELRQNKGLYLYDIKNNRVCDALPDVQVFFLGKNKKNEIWLSVAEKLLLIDSNALLQGKLSLVPPAGGYRKAKDYSAIHLNFDDNSVWIVSRVNGKSRQIQRIHDNGELDSIPLTSLVAASEIKNIFIDRENNIWLSNDGEGVFKIANSSLEIFESPVLRLKQGFVTTVSSLKNVSWFRTTTKRLLRQSNDKVQEFTCNLEQAPIVLYENDGRLLARDHNNIYKATITNKKSIIFDKFISLDPPDFFTGDVIVDKNGFIIACHVKGLTVWNGQNSVFESLNPKNDIIEQLEFDKNDNLWVITRHNGIKIFSLHPETPSQYLQLVQFYPSQQYTGSPRSSVLDKAGLIWIGTRDHGLSAYAQEGKGLRKKYHYNVSNGLTDNFVTSLACDSFNNIIVGTQTGLDRLLFNPEGTYRLENLSKNSNFFAFIKQTWADDKRAYALNLTGMLLQVSASFRYRMQSNLSPALLLGEMKVNNSTVPAKTSTLRFNENNISFFVAAPSFIDEKRVMYTYLLEGSGNSQWSDTSSINSMINLINLSPGNYMLKVKCFFPSDIYPPSELSYAFQIAPPWWQTWWLRVIAGLFIAGLLIIVVRYYYRRKLERQMLILEKQQAIEKERTRIATDMHDDLGAGLSRIKFLSQSMNKKLHDESLRPDLEKITLFSDEMSEKMGEIIWALNEKNDTIADLIAFTRSYVVEYLSNHNIECDATTPSLLPENFIPGDIRRNIFLSVKECLHNVVKHAEATKVLFVVELNSRMKIVIHDNGKGIDWNNQRAFSNGLQNISIRMKEIAGEVNYSNEEGAKVSLTVPLNL